MADDKKVTKKTSKSKKTEPIEIKPVRSIAKYVRISPYKLRRVANVVRGENAEIALQKLKQLPHKVAAILYKVIHSAVSNAVTNNKYDRKSLKLSSIMINEGPFGKRSQPRARGRMFKIIKPTSHVEVIVETINGGSA